MMFNSIEFVVFFAVVFSTFFSLPDRWRTPFLLIASYFFYGIWSVKYLCLLVFTMWLDYFIALKIQQAPIEKKRKQLLWVSIVANLGILFTFKYLNLFLELAAVASGNQPLHVNLILPFGISFYTFHAMSYTIDVYRRVIPAERNFILYSSYVMFFPQLVAGPIARASHLLHQFAVPKRLRWENLIDGSYLIAKGYLFKVVLADTFAGYADTYFGHDGIRTTTLVAQAVYMFAFQIYFDFSGYTLIARGVAKCFDFDLVENFRTPYFATSITDFWRRWHISLSTWLRDYLYISLGGNRSGKLKKYRNLLITMVLGGLWHGGSLTFAAWGLLHGIYLTFEKALGETSFGETFTTKVPPIVRGIITFHLVCIAWIFFRAENFLEASYFLTEFARCLVLPLRYVNPNELYLKLWLMAAVAISYEAIEGKVGLATRFRKLSWQMRFAFIYLAILMTSLCAEINPKAFIYFQF